MFENNFLYYSSSCALRIQSTEFTLAKKVFCPQRSKPLGARRPHGLLAPGVFSTQKVKALI